MKIIFHTNIDTYQTNCWPENLPFVPRKGERVHVSEVFVSYFRDKKLPLRLEVVDVTYTDKAVVCELWYNKTDKELAEMAGAKTL
jgi:hypothetical protein